MIGPMCPRFEFSTDSVKALIDEFLDNVPVKLRYTREEWSKINKLSSQHWREMGFRHYDLQRICNETVHRLKQRRLRMQLED